MNFLVEATYREGIDQETEMFKEIHANHVEYVNELVDMGKVLLGGPKALGGGGFLVFKGESAEEIEALLENDPMAKAEYQTYKVTPWKIFDGPEAILKNI